ncbi:hypothetical protein LWI28_011218 [Acer negundo]|uniref:Uncharacterized protein n=1 Tax=Acer negundo TaxID=4023 RepID=A0AAD5IEC7_ACENE|nr:hypothetical protein LWI28_011218 [Acer negundo]
MHNDTGKRLTGSVMPRHFISLNTWSKTPLVLDTKEVDCLGKAELEIARPQREQPVTHVYELDADEVLELTDLEILALGKETSTTPCSAKKRAKMSASVVWIKKAKGNGDLDPVVAGKALKPAYVRLEKKKATSHLSEPARKVPPMLTFIDSSSEENVDLADQRVEVDVVMDEPSSGQIGEYVGIGITPILISKTSSSEGSGLSFQGGVDPLSDLGSIPIAVVTSASASLPSEGLISPLEMMITMASGHAYIGDSDWD